MGKLLDFFAKTHAPHLHARGRSGTRALLEQLQVAPGEKMLELGFGTGQTQVEMAVRYPEIELHGLEKSEYMLRTARKRLRFCGLSKTGLQLYSGGAFPYPDLYFDAVFCESVLAILPERDVVDTFHEIGRVLKPGGRLVVNESLWREDTGKATLEEINRRCLDSFGLIQCTDAFPHPQDWEKPAAAAGLRLTGCESLEQLTIIPPELGNAVLRRSHFFSAMGALKSRLYPGVRTARRQWIADERQFESYGPFLMGWLMNFQKPG